MPEEEKKLPPKAKATTKATLNKYVVKCDCPTPLLQNPFEATAESKDDAVAQFKMHNGISETDHPITVVEAAK